MQQHQAVSARGKNKATDLKKLIQQACNTQRPRKNEHVGVAADKSKDRPDPLLTKSKCSEDSCKSNKSIKSINIANKLKNSKPNNSSTGTLRNK